MPFFEDILLEEKSETTFVQIIDLGRSRSRSFYYWVTVPKNSYVHQRIYIVIVPDR